MSEPSHRAFPAARQKRHKPGVTTVKTVEGAERPCLDSGEGAVVACLGICRKAGTAKGKKKS